MPMQMSRCAIFSAKEETAVERRGNEVFTFYSCGTNCVN